MDYSIFKYALVALALSFSASSYAEKDHNWTFKRKLLGSLIYKSKKSTKLVLNYQKKGLSEKVLYQHIEDIESAKRKTLALIGVLNWTIQKKSIRLANTGVTQVYMSGFYKNRKKQTVFFVEHHFYSPSKTLHLLLENKNKKSLSNDSVLYKVINFRKTYDI